MDREIDNDDPVCTTCSERLLLSIHDEECGCYCHSPTEDEDEDLRHEWGGWGDDLG